MTLKLRDFWPRLSVLAIAFACALLGANAIAADAPAKLLQATLQLPAEFPLDLPTVLRFDCPGADQKVSCIVIEHKSLVPNRTLAQRETGTNRFLAIAAVHDKSLVGSSTACDATPDETASQTKTVSIEKMSDGYEFRDASRLVMVYRKDPVSRDGKHTRANYIHPLNGLDGETISQDFPDDHRHQRGVFWAWHRLFVGDQKLGDNWATTDFLSVVKRIDVIEQGPVFATLQVSVDWTSGLLKGDDGKPKPVVDETTMIRLFKSVGDAQYVDFIIALKPLLPDVKFGGAEVSGGYSGFTVRVKPPAGMTISDASGKLPGGGEGTVSSWADASGAFGEKGTSGVAILCHPASPVFPPKWVVRGYGMQNVAYPGLDLVTLPQDHPLVLRHRLVVHRGDAAAARTAEHQRSYESGDKK